MAPARWPACPKRLAQFGWQRLMLCTSRSQRANGRADSVESLLGDRLVAVYDHVQPHVPDVQVAEALALAQESEVQAIIGLGGGSPIGMAKAVAAALEEQRTGRPARAAFPTDQPLVPVIAIPTTYAGSEMTAVYGVTHTRENPPAKVTVSDPKIAPKLVIYDPELTLDLPPEMTASTGINALAHCIEALYSLSAPPALDRGGAERRPADRQGPAALLHPRGGSVRPHRDAARRTPGRVFAGQCDHGTAPRPVPRAGRRRRMCRTASPTASSCRMPCASTRMRPRTSCSRLPKRWASAVDGLSPVRPSEAVAQRIFDLVGQMNLPQRLRDVGVKEADLPRLAQLGFQNRTVQNNPKPITRRRPDREAAEEKPGKGGERTSGKKTVLVDRNNLDFDLEWVDWSSSGYHRGSE